MASIKRTVKIAGHSTSITLEAEFWEALKYIAKSRNLSLNALIGEIDEKRTSDNLSGAIRIYILKHYQDLLQEAL